MGWIICAVLALTLSACTAMPMNPDEFKQVASGASLGQVVQLTVPLPFKTVSVNLQAATDQCLNFTRGGIVTNTGWKALPARVKSEFRVLKPGHAQLAIQEDMDGAIYVGGKPDGGMYIFVVDVTAGSATSTNLSMYYGLLGSSDLADIIKSWAAGTNKSCD
jgi:hypothetical protein